MEQNHVRNLTIGWKIMTSVDGLSVLKIIGKYREVRPHQRGVTKHATMFLHPFFPMRFLKKGEYYIMQNICITFVDD